MKIIFRGILFFCSHVFRTQCGWRSFVFVLVLSLSTLLSIPTISEAAICKKAIVLTSDKPLLTQLNKRRAVYKIQNDLDLKGDTLIIPSGSTLFFEGGSLKNGIIVGDKTTLDGSVRCYTSIIGTFSNSEVETGWFIKQKEEYRICEVLNQLINTNIKRIRINTGNYIISETVNLKGGLFLYGDKDVVFSLNRKKIKGSFCLFLLNAPKAVKRKKISKDVFVSNFRFEVNGAYSAGTTSIFRLTNVSNARIKNCTFVDKVPDGEKIAQYAWSMIEMYGCKNCVVDGCYTECVRLVGSYNGYNLLVTNNTGYNTHGTWLECNDGSHNIFEGNKIKGNMLAKNSTISQNATFGIIRNNTVEVNDVESDSMINLGHSSNSTYSNSAKGCIVEGNYLKTNITKGIVVWGKDATDITIKNNVIESTGSWCIITLAGTEKIKIKNNSIRAGKEGQTAILCQSDRSVVGGNTIKAINNNVKIEKVMVIPEVERSCRVFNNDK